MAIVADDDGATTSIADDDRSKIQQYHWQTDVFNNMDIDEVHKNDLFNNFSPHWKKIICIINDITQKLRLLLIYLQVQHENQDDQPTMEENDLRIIAIEPASSDITSAITDDNEHVNGSQELTEEEIEEFIKNEQVAASEGNNAPINNKYTP